MKILNLFVAGAMLIGVAACNRDAGRKEQLGTLAGAGLGALAGSQIGGGRGQMAAIAVGTLVGALAGSEIGKSLDRADRLAMQRTTQSALEESRSGQTVAWSNPDSGNSGSVTPQPAYQTSSGQYCREFQQTIVVGGQEESAYGTACRQSDGSWKIVS